MGESREKRGERREEHLFPFGGKGGNERRGPEKGEERKRERGEILRPSQQRQPS